MLETVKQLMNMSRYSGDTDALQLVECAPMPKDLRRRAEKISRFKECYRNAFMVAAEAPRDIRYVVGYAFPKSVSIPIEHAWVELADGVYHDPTWELFSDLGLNYVPIVSLSMSEAMDIMVAYGESYAPSLYEILNVDRQRERCA